MVQIDLGEVTGTAPRGRNRSPYRRRRRLVAAAAVTIVALTLPAASAVGPSAPLRLRFASGRTNASMYDGGYVVRGDAVYMAHLERDGLHVGRYPLDGSNRPRWDTALGAAGADVWLSWAQPVLVVRWELEGALGRPAGLPILTAVDPDSGRRLWSRPGTWVRPDGHGHAVVGRDTGPDGESELAAVDVHSGNLLWTDRPAGAVALETTPDGLLRWPVRLATVDDGGTVTIRDPAGHRPIASRRIGRQATAVQHLGSVIVTAGDQTTLGLDPLTLEPRWEVNVPVQGFDRCDGDWCAGVGQVLVVDAQTGKAHQVLIPDLDLAATQADNYVATLAGGWTATNVPGPPSQFRVVDPKSGRVVLRADGWSVLNFQQLQVTLGDAYVVVHRGTRERWVGVVPLDRPRLVPLGPLNSDETGQCSAQGRYLACWGIDGVLRIWQYVRP